MQYSSIKTLKAGLIILACIWQLSSCCNGYTCTANSLEVHIILLQNFSQPEMDSIIVKNCQTIGTQTRVVDSFTTSTNSSNSSISLPDAYTALQAAPDSGSYSLLVYFPYDSLAYRLNGITVDTVFCMKCAGKKLYRPEIKTFYLNGVLQPRHDLLINR